MRTALFIVALALALPAGAQEKKPAAPAAPTVKPAAAETPAKAPMKKASSAKRQEDARHCLNESSNTAIIKCAEAYL